MKKYGTQERGNTLTGIAVGIIVGVLLSLSVVWYMNRTALPFRDQGNRAERPASIEPGKIEPLPNKPGDKVVDKTDDKPRFEFYKILPGYQEATPAIKSSDAKADEPLWLQAGAFQKPAEADNMKARLALLGLDAGVQEVNLPDKGKVDRVRLGPFRNADEMSQANSLLSQNGIQATQVKNK
ncbi:MAG: SPOR domain-containing protein [Zoogloeaceae bacterium]|jgi:cell division protein FtsN|nr:SPOR domain-containing protein [Zoogloeaceae bacterium]